MVIISGNISSDSKVVVLVVVAVVVVVVVELIYDSVKYSHFY